MTIRPARPDDAAALVALVNPLVTDTTVTFTTVLQTEDSMRAAIADRLPACLVAERDDGLAGYVSAFPFRAGPGYARIREHTIVVAPGQRGQGAGRGLMAALEAVLRADGIHALVAGISGENPAGCAFHAALGFRRVGLLPEAGWKFGRHIDLVLMQKMLSPPR